MADDSRRRPGKGMQMIMRAPALLYGLGLASQMAKRRIMLLETTGWRSGRRRVSALNFAGDGDTLYVAAGWGPRTSWYRNLLANPLVWVTVGQSRVAARARPVTDEAEVAKAAALMQSVEGGPPKPLRPLLSRFGFDYDAERANAFTYPETLTLVALDMSLPLDQGERQGTNALLWVALGGLTLLVIGLRALRQGKKQP